MAGDLVLEEGRASSMEGALPMLSATCTHITALAAVHPSCQLYYYYFIIMSYC